MVAVDPQGIDWHRLEDVRVTIGQCSSTLPGAGSGLFVTRVPKPPVKPRSKWVGSSPTAELMVAQKEKKYDPLAYDQKA